MISKLTHYKKVGAFHILFTSSGPILELSTHPLSSSINRAWVVMDLITTFLSSNLTSTSSPSLLGERKPIALKSGLDHHASFKRRALDVL